MADVYLDSDTANARIIVEPGKEISVEVENDQRQVEIPEPGIIKVLLSGSGGQANRVHFGTTEYWNAQIDLIGSSGHFYVYTDHAQIDGKDLPGLKIGDGVSYLIDNPFISGNEVSLENHIQNKIVIAEKNLHHSNLKNRIACRYSRNVIFDFKRNDSDGNKRFRFVCFSR